MECDPSRMIELILYLLYDQVVLCHVHPVYYSSIFFQHVLGHCVTNLGVIWLDSHNFLL